MKRTKKIWALLLCAAMLAGLSACSGKAKEEEKGAGYAVELPDGTSLKFEKVPERIVSMGPNITDILFKLGAGDQVVGRTDYCDYPEALKVPSVGTVYEPDIEAIIELKPDLVIGSAIFSEDAGKRLTELGIPVAVLYDSGNMDGVYEIIRKAGELAGKKEEGNRLAEETKKLADDTIAKYQGEEYADFVRPTVYYALDYGYGDYTAGGDTFIGQLIAAAGGDNIAQDIEGWSIDHERLVEADPKIILVRLGEAEKFCKTPGYEELGAVKNGRVYEIDADHLLDRQGYRNAEALKQLAELFHGESTEN